MSLGSRPHAVLSGPRFILAGALGVVGVADILVGSVAPQWAPALFQPLAGLGPAVAAAVYGLVFLLLGVGLLRGLRAAWLLSLLILTRMILLSPVGHEVWSYGALVLVVLLWLRRSSFAAPARAPRFGGAAVLAGFALAWFAGVHVPLVHVRHVHVVTFVRAVRAADGDGDGPLRTVQAVLSSHPAPWPLELFVVLGTLAVFAGLRGMTLPARPPRDQEDRHARALARRLFEHEGANGVGYFAATEDKSVWADPRGHGAVAFRLFGATALVVGDPLAAPSDLPEVLGRFLDHCGARGWTPAFYQTLDSLLPCYRAHGFRALAIGREAIIDLPTFTLTGKRIANVRHSVTHAERAGLRVHLYGDDELDDAVRAQLIALSEEWLAGKGGGEMGFTMGRLSSDGRPSPGARVAVAYGPDNRMQAFITVVPAGGGRGWTLDLMRRRSDAESGTMDLLIARTAEVLRDEGFATLSLSLAPMASCEGDDEDAPALARRARRALYERMNGAYNYRSLFNYKKKFNVRWETRYLVYAGDALLPGALLATARAHLPSVLVARPSLPVARLADRWQRARAGRARAGSVERAA